jgi:hypothetical protein
MTNDKKERHAGAASAGAGIDVLPFVIRNSSFVIFLLLVSCASKEKPKSDYASLRFEQRVIKQIRDSGSIKSPFQEEVFEAKRAVKTSEFKADQFQGKKKSFFGRNEKFKAGSFAQSDKSSNAGNKNFNGADTKSKFVGSTYKT